MIRTAVIPAAGVGTRLFPASHAVKKEMFPVVGANGIARPALMWILIEALSAGVERLIVIVQPDDEAQLRDFFTKPLPSAHYAKLSPAMQAEAEYVLEIGKRIEFVHQREQEGFGHSVWCARDAVGDESFLLMLGDHLYRSNQSESCAEQLVGTHDYFRDKNVVAIHATTPDDLSNRGVIGGSWIDGYPDALIVWEFAEKPTLEYAQRRLSIPGLKDQYLVLFGQYALKPAIFDYLTNLIQRNQRDKGEYQFTSALQSMQADGAQFLGILIEGETYDIGQPHLYVNSLEAFRRE
jgi:UTP--glucose-1-phosphate uridylyltransferase